MDGPAATNARSLWRDPAELRALCQSHSAATRVTPVADSGPDWTIEDGRLKNRRADYFDIGAYREPASGASLTLMSQPAGVVVMLLVASIEGALAALMCPRSEPGLIGLTNLTSTIQSTPANYRRQHGGKATPFIEIADRPEAFGEVLHRSEQYDWGGYYRAKTKGFLAVKLREAVDAPPGYCWVPLDTARALLGEPHLLTNDLRVLLSAMFSTGIAPSVVTEPARGPSTDASLQPLPLTTDFTDSRGVRIGHFRTTTQTREVAQWAQPLLIAPAPMRLRLVSARRPSDGKRVFALRRDTQPGLLEARLWFPAQVAEEGQRRHPVVPTSAEGGRFWQHLIELAWDEIAYRESTGLEWMTREAVSALVTAPLVSSLELRMLWSLVVVQVGQR